MIINDNIGVALNCGAAGVHLGQEDLDPREARRLLGPGSIIGVTAKTVAQARQAQMAGADYLGSGAIFGSQTKKEAIPMTTELLKEIASSVSIPVVAIGGINGDNISRLEGTGNRRSCGCFRDLRSRGYSCGGLQASASHRPDHRPAQLTRFKRRSSS